MYWIYLCLVIFFEVIGIMIMKLLEGFIKVILSVLFIFFYICSLYFLILMLKSIEVLIVYVIWLGMGIIIIMLIGFMYFNESVSLLKIVVIVFIIIGVVILNMIGEKEVNVSKFILEEYIR